MTRPARRFGGTSSTRHQEHRSQTGLELGLDHGTWTVLKRMFPQADVPVIQMSLDANIEGQKHYEISRQLKELREEGVLIIGSGNIVHNLRMVRFDDSAYSWAIDFDQRIANWITQNDHDPIIHYETMIRPRRLPSTLLSIMCLCFIRWH